MTFWTNYSNAAREAGVSVKTIRQYYQILEDTLIGRLLPPWKKAKKSWRTASGTEVDLILGDGEVALEFKASEHAGERTKGLHLFLEENRCKKSYVVSRDPLARKLTGRTTLLPWQSFCEMLWAGEIV